MLDINCKFRIGGTSSSRPIKEYDRRMRRYDGGKTPATIFTFLNCRLLRDLILLSSEISYLCNHLEISRWQRKQKYLCSSFLFCRFWNVNLCCSFDCWRWTVTRLMLSLCCVDGCCLFGTKGISIIIISCYIRSALDHWNHLHLLNAFTALWLFSEDRVLLLINLIVDRLFIFRQTQLVYPHPLIEITCSTK